MPIDPLEFVKKLEAAGVDRRQAEAHAAAIRDTLTPPLATKADLDAAVARLEAKFDAKIDTAVARLEAKIDALGARFEMLLWKRTTGIIVVVIGAMVAVGGAVTGVLLRVLR